MDVLGEDFLAGSRFTGDQDRCLAGGHLFGQGNDVVHGPVFENQLVAVVGHGGEDRCDQFGVRRQGDVFLRAAPDGFDGCARVGSNAAGDYGNVDAFRAQLVTEVRYREGDVYHQQVCATTVAQFRDRLIDGRAMCHLRAAGDRDLGGVSNLAVQLSDDEQAHGGVFFRLEFRRVRS